MRVLVTGAGGYVGRALVARLARDGVRVRALVRREGAAGGADVEELLGDLRDPATLPQAVADVDAIVHAAVYQGAGRSQHAAVNVAGTNAVCAAAVAAGVSRLVHVSTIAVHGWQPPGTVVRPDEAPEPFPERRDDYAWSKIMAERWVRLHAATAGLATVVLRPGIVVDETERLPLGRVTRRLPGGVLLVAGAPWARLPLVHRDDVVEAVVRALRVSEVPATPLAVVGPDQPTHAAWLATLARRGAAPRRVVWLSLGPARRLAALRLGDGGTPSRSHALAWTCQAVRYDTAATQEALGWVPTCVAADAAPGDLPEAVVPASLAVR